MNALPPKISGRFLDASDLPETSSVDPEFFDIFERWHCAPSNPSVRKAYVHAEMEVAVKDLPCRVPSETVLRHALSKMRRAH